MKELSWLLDNLEVEGVAKVLEKIRKGCSEMAPVESRTDINYKFQYLLMFQPDWSQWSDPRHQMDKWRH